MSTARASVRRGQYGFSRISAGAEIAEKYGIYYTLHLEGALNPWEINDRAAAYTETVLDTVDIAKKLSIPILNMHFHQGDFITLPDRKVCLYEQYPEEFRRKLTAFREANEGDFPV